MAMIMRKTKNHIQYSFRKKNLYRVLDTFTDVENVTKYILISKSGKEKFRSKEDLVGIFTTADIIDIVKYIKEI